MGGIRNREEKKKAAKVFSSGGGGGTKGPSVIDKRNQEQKCPYCDRVFKQINRYREHIASKHAEEAAAAGGTDEGGKGSNGAASATATAASSAASSAAAASNNKTMDVGARGGYFTEKSPKMLLHEWCLSNKSSHGKPRYRAKEEETATAESDVPPSFTAKVVIPLISKKSNSDDAIVAFTPRGVSYATADDAEQAAAVAGLHAVAGDRALHRVLPRRFRDQWDSLSVAAEQRRERDERREVAAEKRAARERQLKDAAARRAPTALVMTDGQRSAVADALEAVRGMTTAAATERDADDDESSSSCSSAISMLASRLQSMGFAERDATQAAAAAVGGTEEEGGGGEVVDLSSSSSLLEAALDWACLHIPEDELPRAFAPGAAGKPVTVLRNEFGGRVDVGGGGGGRGRSSSMSLAAAAAEEEEVAAGIESDSSSSSEQDESSLPPDVAPLVGFGYERRDVERALAAASGDVDAAHQSLYDELLEKSSSIAPPVRAPGDDGDGGTAALEEADDEAAALLAIYGEQAATVVEESSSSPSSSCRRVITLALGGDGEGANSLVTLRAWLPRSYPLSSGPTRISVSRSRKSDETKTSRRHRLALRALTLSLAEEAAGLSGVPCLHDLATAALERCEAIDEGKFEELPLLLEEAEKEEKKKTDRSKTTVPRPRPPAPPASASEQAAASAEAMMHQQKQKQQKKRPQQQQQQRRSVGPSPAAIAAESARLSAEAAAFASAASGSSPAPTPLLSKARSMSKTRSSLPVASHRTAILDAVANHRVVMVAGETGCGKSTQVPQFLLEDFVARGRGGEATILVAQPRRVAALGLASRVAAERCEAIGDVVGYSVRLDSRTSARTRLTFCTTGVLLRKLLGGSKSGSGGGGDDDDDDGNENELDFSSLAHITHVVIDEVHERSLDSDLALLLLRRWLAATEAKEKGPKVVLMSATADAQVFCRYFDSVSSSSSSLTSPGVAVLKVPGFTHPVRDLYLEDALAATGVEITRGSKYASKKKEAKVAKAAAEAQRAAVAARMRGGGGSCGVGFGGGGGAEQKKTPDEWDDEDGDDDDDDDSLDDVGDVDISSSPSPTYPEHVLRSLAIADEAAINYDLVEALIAHVIEEEAKRGPMALLLDLNNNNKSFDTTTTGAILVFMPGAPEISKCVRQLESSSKIRQAMERASAGKSGQLLVLPLHGGLSPEAQSRAFARPPPGGRKIVVSTNVAETSVTIDDVTCVIDTGRVKEMAHDPENGVSRLQETWASRAAAKQRRGRAGRVRPGVCFKLFSRKGEASTLPADTPPEALRSPLEGICLSLKVALGTQSSVAEAASELVTPPPKSAVDATVAGLVRLGAMMTVVVNRRHHSSSDSSSTTTTERLTPLGRMLAALPMDVRIAKALVYACLLQCAGPVLTAAAALGVGRPLFVLPPPAASAGATPIDSLRAEADRAKKKIAKSAVSSRSDHLALVEAFNAWDAACVEGSNASSSSRRRASRDFCAGNFLSEGALEATRTARADLARTLAELGLLDRRYAEDARRPGTAAAAVRRALEIAESGGGGSGRLSTASTPKQSDPDLFSHSARVVKAALCAGFSPAGLLRVEHPADKFAKTLSGSVPVDADPKTLRFRDERGARVFLSPGSVCFDCGKFESGWLVASGVVALGGSGGGGGSSKGGTAAGRGRGRGHDLGGRRRGNRDGGRGNEAVPAAASAARQRQPKQQQQQQRQSSNVPKPTARLVSMVPAYSVLLFGGRLDVRHAEGEVVVDGFARFAAPARIGVLVRELRAAVDGLLDSKLRDPRFDLAGSPATQAMHRLLETDGF